MLPFVLIIGRKVSPAKEGSELVLSQGWDLGGASELSTGITTVKMKPMVCLGSGHGAQRVHRATHLFLGHEKEEEDGIVLSQFLEDLNPCDRRHSTF